jgi:multidrug transporter EmrE-like cation transporter
MQSYVPEKTRMEMMLHARRKLNSAFGRISHCVVSAVAGSVASVAIKFAFDEEHSAAVADLLGRLLHIEAQYNAMLSWIASLALVGVFVLMNSIMLTRMVRATEALGTASATATTSALSFVASGAAGYLFFSEQIGTQWWVGIFFVLLGIFFIQYEPEDPRMVGMRYRSSLYRTNDTSTPRGGKTNGSAPSTPLLLAGRPQHWNRSPMKPHAE